MDVSNRIVKPNIANVLDGDKLVAIRALASGAETKPFASSKLLKLRKTDATALKVDAKRNTVSAIKEEKSVVSFVIADHARIKNSDLGILMTSLIYGL